MVADKPRVEEVDFIELAAPREPLSFCEAMTGLGFVLVAPAVIFEM
jgi:4-hydroxyphenylpyruvate dioxygenase-like putative hemolysin